MLLNEYQTLLLVAVGAMMVLACWHNYRAARHIIEAIKMLTAPVIEEPRPITKPSDLNGPVGLGG